MTGGDVPFHEIYDRFHPQVYAYCRRRTRDDDVQDAVAETFLIAWRKTDDIPSGDQALPWLYGVAYRVLTHQWRSAFRRQKLAEKLSLLGLTPMDLPEDIVIARQDHRQLLAALSGLRGIDQEILRLTAWEELSQAEIAVVLGITVGAVRQRLYEAKRKLAHEYNRLERRRTDIPAAQKGGAW